MKIILDAVQWGFRANGKGLKKRADDHRYELRFSLNGTFGEYRLLGEWKDKKNRILEFHQLIDHKFNH